MSLAPQRLHEQPEEVLREVYLHSLVTLARFSATSIMLLKHIGEQLLAERSTLANDQDGVLTVCGQKRQSVLHE